MARYSFFSTPARIIILLIIVLGLAGFGIWWLNRLGLIDSTAIISPILKTVGLQKQTQIESVDEPYLLEKRRLNKQMEGLEIQLEQIDIKTKELEEKEKLLTQMAEDLAEKEKNLEDKEKSFNEKVKAFDDRRVNLEQNAQYFVGMRPENAVDILLEMEDTDVIDILRITESQAQAAGETSLVAYWLSLMPKERAAKLQRMMAKKVSS